jgi:2,4-dienoyl-CoA reductase-like NADH-dependent reductase (Old Yellow Enzyme family)
MSVLFEPGRIGNLELRNRFVRSATVECLATDDGRVTDAYLRAYELLAKGGVGLILPGNYYVNALGRAYPRTPSLDRDEMIADLRKVTAVVHKHGAKIVAQLNHGGRQADPKLIGGQPVAPSPVRDKLSFVKPRQMTESEIAETIDDFGEAARRAREAGFDGVQIHAAHGYLINQFLSGYTNRRKDAWGGSLQNRLRFVTEVYQAMRTRVGSDFPILVKINAIDFVEGGVTPEECVAACRRLEEIGIAAIEVSGGIAEKGLSTIKGEIPMDLVMKNRGLVQRIAMRFVAPSLRKTASFEECYFLPQAATVKKSVSIPVMAVGGMRTRARMEDALQSSQADFISLCRPFIRQPNLARLFERGKSDAITCTSCNRCSMEILLHAKPMRCYRTSS